jgi:hypothetical protein
LRYTSGPQWLSEHVLQGRHVHGGRGHTRKPIVGDGDLKRIEAPVLSVGDSFEVYEARVMEETYSEEANRRVGRKVFEYMLTPKVSGTYSLRPQFSYFSPAQNQFVTLSDQVFDLTIRPGSRKSPFDPGSLPGKTGQALQTPQTGSDP